MRRAILELGAGTDLHGKNYTKAALRAVNDALHHSSLSFIRTLGLDPESMQVNVCRPKVAPYTSPMPSTRSPWSA